RVPRCTVRHLAHPAPPRGLDAKGRRRRRQCGDGVLLPTAPEERPGPEAVADPRRAPDRDRHLDRTQVSPPPSTGPSGSIDPHRIRDHHEPGREPRGLTPQLSPNGAAVPVEFVDLQDALDLWEEAFEQPEVAAGDPRDGGDGLGIGEVLGVEGLAEGAPVSLEDEQGDQRSGPAVTTVRPSYGRLTWIMVGCCDGS